MNLTKAEKQVIFNFLRPIFLGSSQLKTIININPNLSIEKSEKLLEKFFEIYQLTNREFSDHLSKEKLFLFLEKIKYHFRTAIKNICFELIEKEPEFLNNLDSNLNELIKDALKVKIEHHFLLPLTYPQKATALKKSKVLFTETELLKDKLLLILEKIIYLTLAYKVFLLNKSSELLPATIKDLWKPILTQILGLILFFFYTLYNHNTKIQKHFKKTFYNFLTFLFLI